jgi:hypothetical protein
MDVQKVLDVTDGAQIVFSGFVSIPAPSAHLAVVPAQFVSHTFSPPPLFLLNSSFLI